MTTASPPTTPSSQHPNTSRLFGLPASNVDHYGMAQSERIDLDTFYSYPPLDVWRRVLGDQMHYHHGIWDGNESWDAALDNAVLSLARHIEPDARVVDLGCGWGGPASVLSDGLGCSVLCVTVSQAQAAHCASRGLDVRHMDLDHEIPDGAWSVGWWMESLEHLEEPEKALARLRSRCEKLVIRVNTCEAAPRRLFAGSMPMRSARFYVDALDRAGWKVTHLSNRRPASVRSASKWLGGLKGAGIVSPDDPHLRALWDYSVFFTTRPWMYANFPLIDIVAE